MKKIPTIFQKSKTNPRLVEPIANDQYVSAETSFKIKIDGTSCLIKEGIPYCRYDAKLFKRKRGRIIKEFTRQEIQQKLPIGSIACQEPDTESGHWPHWIPLDSNDPQHQYIIEGYNNLEEKIDGTYECIGPKIQSNPHFETEHLWIPHFAAELDVDVFGDTDINALNPFEVFNHFSEFLKEFPWEGLVAYVNDQPVGKIRRKDYGYEKTDYKKASNLFEKEV